MKTRCIAITKPWKAEVIEIEIPAPGPGEVLIETAYSCISPGTELRCYQGNQVGSVYPFIPGYQASGTILEVGADVALVPGTRVQFGGTQYANPVTIQWGGHVAHGVFAASEVLALPGTYEDLLTASLTKVAAISHHGFRLANLRTNDKVAVIGLGVIGQVAARLYHAAGAEVLATDLCEHRVGVATAGGVPACIPEEGLPELFSRQFPAGADIVVDCSGAPAVLPLGVQIAKELPWDNNIHAPSRYVIQGSYPDEVAIPYQEAFLKELTFLVPRDSQLRDHEAILGMLANGSLALRDLISDTIAPENINEAYQRLLKRGSTDITFAIRWNEPSA